jgi:hypothetical protein
VSRFSTLGETQSVLNAHMLPEKAAFFSVKKACDRFFFTPPLKESNTRIVQIQLYNRGPKFSDLIGF